MSSNSPGGGGKLATVKTLFDSATNIFSLRNWNASSVFNSIPNDSTLEYAHYNITANASNEYEPVMVQAVSPMYIYLTPCLVALGITGNLLSMYVFYKSRKLRLQSSSQYLNALAVSDSVFLLQLIPAWLSNVEVNGLFQIREYCKITVYASYVSCTLSAWLVLAFTIERCFAVLYPLRRPAVCTVRRARCVILALVVGALVLNIPVLNFAGTGDLDCSIAQDRLEDAERFNWVDTTMVFTVPLIIILFVNIWIGTTLCKFQRNRTKLLKEGREPDSVFPRLQRRITCMLLIVSSVFFVFNVPAYVMRVYAYSNDWETSENGDMLVAIHIVSMVLFNSTFGINFFLYCLSGQNFRRALVQHVPCFGWLARRTARLAGAARSAARAPSLSTSAASNGTDATCNVECVRTSQRRRPYIYRKKFDNRWHRRSPVPLERTECFEMQEVVPRAGPSCAPAARLSTVSKRRTLSRVVTAAESKYAHM